MKTHSRHQTSMQTMGKTPSVKGVKQMTDEEVTEKMYGPMTWELTEKEMEYVHEGWECMFDGWMESREHDCVDDIEKDGMILNAWEEGKMSKFDKVLIETTEETIRQGYPVNLQYMRNDMREYFCTEFDVKYDEEIKEYYID